MNEHESITAPLSARRRAWNGTMRALLYAAAAFICALLVFLIGYILYRGIPNLSWQFLSSEESVINDIQGILPAIINTVYVVFWTLLIILPLGVGSAIYLTEYATNKKLVSIIEFATETLAGMPSIIFALVGMMVFCQALGLGTSLIAGSLTLVMMTLPTIIRTTQESLKTVPQSYREGSLALGYTRWQTIWHVVLKSATPSLMTAVILGMTRAFGETLAVRMVIGGVEAMPAGLIDSASTITTTLTTSMAVYATGSVQNDTLWTLGLLLMGMSLIFILIIHLIGAKGAKARG